MLGVISDLSVLYAIYGLRQLRRKSNVDFFRALPYWGLMAVGVCSGIFHTTLHYHTQMSKIFCSVELQWPDASNSVTSGWSIYALHNNSSPLPSTDGQFEPQKLEHHSDHLSFRFGTCCHLPYGDGWDPFTLVDICCFHLHHWYPHYSIDQYPGSSQFSRTETSLGDGEIWSR